MTITTIAAEQRVVLQPVSWTTYCALVEESENAGRRLTYDRGVLEIMSPMMPHESAKRLIGRMVEMFTFYRSIDIRSSSSTTFRRSDLQRGFEADESYYIQHSEAIVDKAVVDLTIDPPPDLVIEVDMTNSRINKLALFAAMGIPEVWRYDGRKLYALGLQGRKYEELDSSVVLPGFPIPLAEQLLAQRSDGSETKLMRRFVDRL